MFVNKERKGTNFTTRQRLLDMSEHVLLARPFAISCSECHHRKLPLAKVDTVTIENHSINKA
eukprot:1590322-Amphidinium_carterae.2